MPQRHKTKRSTRSNGKAQPRKGITTQDMNWGCIFTGTKEELQAAGLVPAKFKLGQKYFLPLNWSDLYNEACFGKGGPIPTRWDADVHEGEEEGLLRVWVKYTYDKDLAVRDRLAPVLNAVDAIRQLVLRAQTSYKAAAAAVFALEDVREQLDRVAPPKLSEVVPQAIREARHAQA